jgi:hypothetical protein
MTVYQCIHWLPEGIEFDDRGFLDPENAGARLAALNQGREGKSQWELTTTPIVDTAPPGPGPAPLVPEPEDSR